MKGRPSLREKVITGLPGTRAQIGKKSGTSSSTVGKWIAVLHAEGAIHVSKWLRSKLGSKRPVYVLGAGIDAKEPPTLTDQQSQQRYDKRHPGRRKEIRDRFYLRKTTAKKRGGWMAALIFQKEASQ
jgi:hypothetical protein